MTWNWLIFFGSLVPWTILVMFVKGYMNAANVARHGPEADYRTNPGAAIVGSILAAAVYAAITTAVIGFL